MAKKKQPGHARKSKMKTVKVKIVAEGGLGSHEEGAIVDMERSTALAVIKSGKAQKSGNWK